MKTNAIQKTYDPKGYGAVAFRVAARFLSLIHIFGVDVQVTAPPEMVKKMRSAIKKMKKRYKT